MRKILLSLIISFTAATNSLAANVIFKGDANGDGSIGLTDIMIIADRILGNEAKGLVFWAADVNGDGELTTTDIMLVADIILKGGAPGPNTDDEPANPEYPVLAPPANDY